MKHILHMPKNYLRWRRKTKNRRKVRMMADIILRLLGRMIIVWQQRGYIKRLVIYSTKMNLRNIAVSATATLGLPGRMLVNMHYIMEQMTPMR